MPLTAPVDRGAFQKFLRTLPISVFRAKGFIRLTESPGKLHTFQQVRDQAELLLLPLENDTDLTTGLVFIGPHLDVKHIRELAQALSPEASRANFMIAPEILLFIHRPSLPRGRGAHRLFA